MAPEPAVGLLAGSGRLPVILARAIKGRGHSVVCLALEGADAALASVADHVHPVDFGQVEQVLAVLGRYGADRLVLAGGVSRAALLRPGDGLFARWMAEAADRRDHPLFLHVAARLEAAGVRVVGPLEFAPDLAAPEGVLTRRRPSAEQWEDIRTGIAVARALADLDVGQTVVLRRGVILAAEAAEGTDIAVRRGAALAEGVVVVKAARSRQDPRFDLPTVGPDTAALLAQVRAAVLAVEARRTLLLDREETVRIADAAGLAVVGVPGPERPGHGGG
ncbi:MAG: UDP-2,3-diacylglucosamine diphosphatase LpxI [Armatimonadota bacterium]|nr:UDP-2,3-diacylglucosamine diphosphatase LpxI [Armatimonadota bacterium]MDR7404766.1 UDP-2,3-diacylglucosamine diphosphatase LpxI [Armatimonadota bacterium]